MSIDKLMKSLPESYSPADQELVLRAYRVAERAHEGQTRASGEPYVTHCVAVAAILSEFGVSAEVIAAGLLHDVVEDTSISLEDLRRDFGNEIAMLVDGVTKLTQLPRVSRGDQHPEETQKEEELREIAERRGLPEPDEQEEMLTRSRRYDAASETLRKTFLAMGENINVVFIKLADRLHNMRTLGKLPEIKRKRIAQQTLDIFAPLANRLGIWQMKSELEDLAFRYTNPENYGEIKDKLDTHQTQRDAEMKEITDQLENVLSKAGIQAEISSRSKHIYSIYKKMVRKDLSFEMVYDVRGVRIIVPDIPACYSALGVIHTHWRPLPGQFDDYIASPKDNFYQSLHTSVVYSDGKTLEVQIRTPEMHEYAERGLGSHRIYKEQRLAQDLNYIKSLMEWRFDVSDAKEFVDSMKTDVFQDRVYIFTPKGDIIDLPAGSTPIDFAYHVHTDVGNRCRGAKVNGKLVSLDYALKTGDKVEVITAKRGGPSRDWLNTNLGLVKTQRARAKIRYWFKRQARDQNIAQGKSILDKELRRLGLTDVNVDRLSREFDQRSLDNLYESIGCGDLPLGRLVNHLTLGGKDDGEEYVISTRPVAETVPSSHEAVSVLGLKGLLTNFARCCNPAPGDDIVGYITRGRGATIHRQDCPNILRVQDRERLVRVTWGEARNTYPVPVRVKAYDRDGLMKDVATLIADEGVNMTGINVDVNRNLAILDLTLEVPDVAKLSRVLDRLENLPNVMAAQRVKPG